MTLSEQADLIIVSAAWGLAGCIATVTIWNAFCRFMQWRADRRWALAEKERSNG